MSLSSENNFVRTLKRLEFDILSGFFKPRERLIEKELCDRYDVSRGAIRKVLQELEFNHLIKHFSNRGATVAEPTKKQLNDIYNTRMLLENYAIDLVMQNAGGLDLYQIKKHQQAFEKAFEDENLKGFMDANRLFHQKIFDAGSNDIILEMIDQLRKRSHIWQHYIVGQPARLQKTIEEHEEIVRCLLCGDAEELKKVNGNHLTQGYKSYMEDLMIA